MDSLTELATAAAGGNADATAGLLQRVWPDAFRIAWSMLGERAAAEDAAQEACARVLTSIAALRKPEAFPAWFYRIVVNESKRRRRTLTDVASMEERPHRGDDPSSEDRIDLRRALAALDQPLRVATVFAYYYGLNGNEIAAIVGASPMTIRWRLFVARRRLKTMLGAQQPSLSEPRAKRRGEYADEPHAVR